MHLTNILIDNQTIQVDSMPMVSSYHEYSVPLGKGQRLNNVLRVPVTLAAEMLQEYHRSEIPFLDKALPKDIHFIKVLKDGNELKKAVLDLQARKIESLPFVMPHSPQTFTRDQIPHDLKQYITEGIPESLICGNVKEITYDAATKKIKGVLYLPISKTDPKFLADVENGKVINVSIGFVCDWEGSGIYEGTPYVLKQTNLRLGHLAGLVHAQGKCPAGICGINQDQNHADHIMESNYNILHYPLLGMEYYAISLITSDTIPAECPCKKDLPISDPISKQTVSPSLPKYSDLTIEPHSKVSSMTEQELQKMLDEANAKLKAVTDSQLSVKITTLESQLHDQETKVAALNAVIAQRDKEMEECKEKAKKAQSDAREKFSLEQKLSAVGITKIGEKALGDCCIHDMKVYIEAYDIALKNQGIPKPDQGTHDNKVNGTQPEKVLKASVSADEINKLREGK